MPISLAGWTDFSGRIDYRVNPDAVREKLAGKLPGDEQSAWQIFWNEIGQLQANARAAKADAESR